MYINVPAQTLESKTPNDILEDVDKVVKCLYRKQVIYDDYDIGEPYNRFEIKNLLRLQKILCMPYCPIKKEQETVKSLIKRKLSEYGL